MGVDVWFEGGDEARSRRGKNSPFEPTSWASIRWHPTHVWTMGVSMFRHTRCVCGIRVFPGRVKSENESEKKIFLNVIFSRLKKIPYEGLSKTERVATL